MVLKPNPEEDKLMKKQCKDCGRKIVVSKVDWKNRIDFVCQTCKTLGDERSIAQKRMAESKGISERTVIKEIREEEESQDQKD